MQTGIKFNIAFLTIDGEGGLAQVLVKIVLPILVLIVAPQLFCLGAYNYLNLKKRIKYLEDQMVHLTGKSLPPSFNLDFEPKREKGCDDLCSHLNFGCPGRKRYGRLQVRIHALEQAIMRLTGKGISSSCCGSSESNLEPDKSI